MHTLSRADEFLVLASDGAWEFLTSEEVVKFVRTSCKSAKDSAQRLADLALLQWSMVSHFYRTPHHNSYRTVMDSFMCVCVCVLQMERGVDDITGKQI